MTDKSQLPDRELVEWAVKGDEVALDYNTRVHNLIQVWDDIHDGDLGAGKEGADMALFDAMLVLPKHPFAVANPALTIVFQCAALSWMSGNRLEKTGDAHALHASYMLRMQAWQITQYSALIVGGIPWAIEVGEALWMHKNREPLAEYVEEHSAS